MEGGNVRRSTLVHINTNIDSRVFLLFVVNTSLVLYRVDGYRYDNSVINAHYG